MIADPDPGSGNAAPARLVHRTATRLRLQLMAPPDTETARVLADSIARIDGVSRARVRPRTASVIVDTLLPSGTVLDALRDGGLIALQPVAHPPPVGKMIDLGLLQADMAIGKQTDGALDFRTILGLLLLIAAGGQVLRGKIAGPALTLVTSAYSVLAPRR